MSLVSNFPKEFKFKVDSISDDGLSMKLYANIPDITSVEKWVSSYSKLTNTRWIVSKTQNNREYFVCRKVYTCKFSRINKVNRSSSSSKINLDCKASIDIKVQYITSSTMFKYQHIKENLPATILINLHHSHDVTSAEALSYLPPSSATFDRFQCYFNSKLGVAAAMREHAAFLQEEMGGVDGIIVNGTHNPKPRTVQYWYANWKKKNLDDATGPEKMKKLDDTITALQKVGAARIKYREDPFALVVMTPLMERAQKLPRAREMIFIDSTASCDLEQHTITFVFTESVAGALPLAVIVTNGQSTAEYMSGFALLKEVVGDLSPRYIMTDDSDAERDALRNIFSDSTLLLYSFHILQSKWRWLCDTNQHDVLKEDRQVLYRLFKNIVIANTANDAEEAYNVLKTSSVSAKYLHWIQHIENYWIRREDWCLAYHDKFIHGNNVNNCAEISARLFKDILLQRLKDFNLVNVVSHACGEMNRYYKDCLLDFSQGKIETKKRLLRPFLKTMAYLTMENIVQINDNHYNVPSSDKNKHLTYEVDLEFGWCTCVTGHLGKLCKHQAGVYIQSFGIATSTVDDRYAMAVVALGDKASIKDYYKPFVKEEELFTFECSHLLHCKLEDCTTITTLPSQNDLEQSSTSECGYLPPQITLEQPSTSTFISTLECDGSENIQNILHVLYKKIIEMSPTSYDLNQYLLKIKKIKNPSDMSAFLNNYSTEEPSTPTNVQPTAVAGMPFESPSRVSIKRKR